MGNSSRPTLKRSKGIEGEEHIDPMSKQKKVATANGEEEEEEGETTMETLVKNAECIVCFEIPRGQVFTCKNGQVSALFFMIINCSRRLMVTKSCWLLKSRYVQLKAFATD